MTDTSTSMARKLAIGIFNKHMANPSGILRASQQDSLHRDEGSRLRRIVGFDATQSGPPLDRGRNAPIPPSDFNKRGPSSATGSVCPPRHGSDTPGQSARPTSPEKVITPASAAPQQIAADSRDPNSDNSDKRYTGELRLKLDAGHSLEIVVELGGRCNQKT